MRTIPLKLMSDILLVLDSGNLALLTLLDLSAAFDSVDHVTLIQRPRRTMVLVTLLSRGSHLTSVDRHSTLCSKKVTPKFKSL